MRVIHGTDNDRGFGENHDRAAVRPHDCIAHRRALGADLSFGDNSAARVPAGTSAMGRSLATPGPRHCYFIRKTGSARRAQRDENWMDISMVLITDCGNEGSARPTPALRLAR
jgi:hypothetical protein